MVGQNEGNAGLLVAGASRRTMLRLLTATGLGWPAALLGARLDVPDLAAAQESDEVSRRITARTRWRRTGDTTLRAFRREFARIDSPMLAEAERIYRRVQGLSRLYLAMSYVEKKHDTYTRIIPQSHHNALAVKRANGSGRWKRYPSYATGAMRWVQLLTNPRGPYAETVTLRDLIAVYAPASENDVDRYLAVLTDQMNSYPDVES